jgi:hypothetical protein
LAVLNLFSLTLNLSFMTTHNQNLETLVAQLDIQHAQKADYVVNPHSSLFMSPSTGAVRIVGSNGGDYEPNGVFHEGMAEKLHIPMGYYKRMQTEAPELLANNVNAWLHRYQDKGLLVRTFESNQANVARAVLSDRYSMLDNYDVLFAALKAIREAGVHVVVEEASVTDKRLYINVTAPEIEIQAEKALRNYIVRHGANSVSNGIIAGLTITNSEVGYGKFQVNPRAKVIRCSNGMIGTDDSFARQHLGAKMESGQIIWSEKSQQKNFELVISQVQDAVKTFLSPQYLTGMIQRFEKASEEKLDNPLETVQLVTRELSSRVAFSDAERKGVLDAFIGGGDLHASGVFNALTYHAQTRNADDRYDIERAAFDILPRIKQFDKPSQN